MSKFNESKIVELLCKARNKITEEDSDYLMAWLMQENPGERQRIMEKANRIDMLSQKQ